MRVVILILLLLVWGNAYAVPNVTQGAAGTKLSGPNAEEQGRLTVIMEMGGYIITMPEGPGSEAADHRKSCIYDVSTPASPVKVAPTNPSANNCLSTGAAFLTHGGMKRDNQVFTGGGEALTWNGGSSFTQNDTWLGYQQRDQDCIGSPAQSEDCGRVHDWNKSGMHRPWNVTYNWNYDNDPVIAKLVNKQTMLAEWNIVAETGLAGFGQFMGNILVYAADQRRGGVATYDASDIYFEGGEWKPRLLDVLVPADNLGNAGGYWTNIIGKKIVQVARDRTTTNSDWHAQVSIIDFSDPSDLQLVCTVQWDGKRKTRVNTTGSQGTFSLTAQGAVGTVGTNGTLGWGSIAQPMYMGFHDGYAYVDNYEIDLNNCDIDQELDVWAPGAKYTSDVAVSTTQYSKVLGNLWFTGGYPNMPNTDGWAIWVRQSAAETGALTIAGKIPDANEVNYDVANPLSISFWRPLNTNTAVTTGTNDGGETESITLHKIDVGGGLGDEVCLDYVVDDVNMMTIRPTDCTANSPLRDRNSIELDADTTYEITITTDLQDTVGNAIEETTWRFSTGATIEGGGGPPASDPAEILSVVINQTPEDVSVNVDITVTCESSPNNCSHISLNAYEIYEDGDTPAWEASNVKTFNWANAGTYWINVRGRNNDGVSALERYSVEINDLVALTIPKSSGELFCDETNDLVYGVNPENNGWFKVDASTDTKSGEYSGVTHPKGITIPTTGEVWVTSQRTDEIMIYNAAGTLQHTIAMDYGDKPTQLINYGNDVYVTLYGSGDVVKFDATDAGTPPLKSGATELALSKTVKHMALNSDGTKLYVSRNISGENWGEVYEVTTSSMTLTDTIYLYEDLSQDALDNGSGVPNYISGIQVTPDDAYAYVVANKSNLDRGELNTNQELDPDNTVRTLLMQIDLATNIEDRTKRFDFDNASSPVGVGMNADGTYLFVAMEGKNTLVAFALDGSYDRSGTFTNLKTDTAPRALCEDDSQQKLFSKNFTGRSVSSIDLSSGVAAAGGANPVNISTVASEVFSASELNGQMIFYNSFLGIGGETLQGQMSSEGYLSCGTCHLDGGNDGATWDRNGPPVDEGLRNTVSLYGRGGTRFGDVHWSSNFDEVQDFEHDMRGPFGGTGLMDDGDFNTGTVGTPLGDPKAGYSTDLDDLDAYMVTAFGKDSIPRSPHRAAAGTINTAGKAIFREMNCHSCHANTAYTTKRVEDVGTLSASSGERLGATLTDIKTPSLLGAHTSAPYFHNGMAKTIYDVFKSVGGVEIQAESGTNSGGDVIDQSAAFSYLRGGQGIRLETTDSVTFSSVDGGAGGTGKLRVRYCSSTTASGNIQVNVNGGGDQAIALETLPLVDGADVNCTYSDTIDVTLSASTTNSIVITRDTTSVILDEITVSEPAYLALAAPHLEANDLPTADLDNLVDYVLELDVNDASEDVDTDIFKVRCDPDGSNEFLTLQAGSGVYYQFCPEVQ